MTTPAYLNRCVGLALTLVRRNPFCPFCKAALDHLNHARRLAKAGFQSAATIALWRASRQLRKAGV
jgi:hypothetical protein